MKNRLKNIKSNMLFRLASNHIAGNELQDAINECWRANNKGFSATLGYWNSPEESSENVLKKYLETMDVIAKNFLTAQMAIKLHALNYDRGMLGEVVEEAKNNNVSLHFDSHGFETIEKALEAVQWVRKNYSKIGCTLPSRF